MSCLLECLRHAFDDNLGGNHEERLVCPHLSVMSCHGGGRGASARVASPNTSSFLATDSKADWFFTLATVVRVFGTEDGVGG